MLLLKASSMSFVLVFYVLCVNYVFTRGLNGNMKGFTMVMDDSHAMGYQYLGFDGFVSMFMNKDMMEQISESILVSFNEEEQHVRTKTGNATIMKQDLMNFKARSNIANRDCAKNVLSAIELGLKESENGTNMMVITNAPAKDLHKLDEVKRLCQEKQVEMVIALSHDRLNCGMSNDSHGVTAYKEIERACPAGRV